MTHTFSTDPEGIARGVTMLRSFLESKGIRGNENIRKAIMLEEILSDLAAHADPDSTIRISPRSVLGTIQIEIFSRGKEYDFGKSLAPDPENQWAEPDSGTENALRSMILNAYADKMRYRHQAGVNKVRTVIARPTKTILWTLTALAAAIILGTAAKFTLSPDFLSAMNDNVFSTVKTLYMNALKMIAAPVVFFSIISAVSQLGSMTQLGRIGIRVLGLYLLTTLIAVGIGIGVTSLFRPGNPSLAEAALSSGTEITAQSMNGLSVKDMITGIVPDNFLRPFLESRMLQLIFIAVLCGIAVGMIGDYSQGLRTLFESLNQLFMRVTSIIMRVTPFVVFCSVVSLTTTIGIPSLMSLLGMVGTFLAGLLCMMLVYCFIMLISGVNPLKFFAGYAPVMLQVFSIASSNAAIPLNMEFCRHKMKISPKLYSFSIPLGATMNMDGTSILLAVQSLTLARIFGVEIPSNMLLSLAFAIIVLSVGAPGVPGSGVIMMSMLMELLGVPVEAVALVLGITTLMGMFVCMSNCLGDVAVTTMVARREKMMDTGAPSGTGKSGKGKK